MKTKSSKPIKSSTKSKNGLKAQIKKRNRVATESALIDAAIELFSVKGFDRTRTLEIAQKAGVNEALITRYFGGKEGLLIAVMQDGDASKKMLKSPSQEFPKLGETTELKEALRQFFENGLRHIRQKEAFIRIILSQALVEPKMAELLRKKTMEQGFLMILEQLKKQFGGRIRESELESLVMLLLASNFSINFMGRTVHRIENDRVDGALDLLVNALVSYLES